MSKGSLRTQGDETGVASGSAPWSAPRCLVGQTPLHSPAATWPPSILTLRTPTRPAQQFDHARANRQPPPSAAPAAAPRSGTGPVWRPAHWPLPAARHPSSTAAAATPAAASRSPQPTAEHARSAAWRWIAPPAVKSSSAPVASPRSPLTCPIDYSWIDAHLDHPARSCGVRVACLRIVRASTIGQRAAPGGAAGAQARAAQAASGRWRASPC